MKHVGKYGLGMGLYPWASFFKSIGPDRVYMSFLNPSEVAVGGLLSFPTPEICQYAFSCYHYFCLFSHNHIFVCLLNNIQCSSCNEFYLLIFFFTSFHCPILSALILDEDKQTHVFSLQLLLILSFTSFQVQTIC